MVTRLRQYRKAIAMIELIFAIVVMGIVLLSVPMILNQTRKSSYTGFQQESIAALASEVGLITTHQWDEADTNLTLGTPILTVQAGDGELDEVIPAGMAFGQGLRLGMPLGSSRSFRQNSGGRSDASLMIGLDAGEGDVTDYDDIDDFNGKAIQLTELELTTTEEGDYIDKDISIMPTITYRSDDSIDFNATSINFVIDDAVPSPLATTNIKFLSVTLTTTSTADELDKTITLQAFSCNIGGYTLETRSF